ncbi:MAG: LysM peptidoglycan-binding domain-containing protein [Erysipelotrichales bacterium]|nr:LysM peptidoglycan-binding domain-containing protein [Erysipelotrichales bacterium]
MCTKVVERLLDFNHEIKQLYRIDLEEDLRYIKSDQGITANGFIYVIGKYDDGIDTKDFEELLEVDILAPFEKLEDIDGFKVEIEDYDYHILHGDLLLEITLQIQGLVSEKSRIENKVNDMFQDMEEKTINDEKNKHENIETIEEKIEDQKELTADTLTTLIQKVIHEDKETTIPVSADVDTSMLEVQEEIPPVIEDILRDEFIDHIENRYDREYDYDSYRDIVEDTLEDALIDHITGMREVVAILQEAPLHFMDHFEEESEKKQEGASCQFGEKYEEVDLVEIDPMYEKTYDHLVLHGNPKEEYEYQHQLCNQGKEREEEKYETFDLPIFDNTLDLFDIISLKGGFYMFEEESVPIQEDSKFELGDFMKALDLFEEEIEEYIEPIESIEDTAIRSIPKEEIVEKPKSIQESKEEKIEEKDSKVIEDIFDDTFNAMSKIRYVIVRKGDTYASLAKRYNIEEHVLAKANNYKVLESRCVIEIPIR